MIRSDTDDLIAFLNTLVEIDPHAVAELLCSRVVCNQALADHPTVQVAIGPGPETFVAPGQARVGLLGILNGYCGTIEEGPRAGWGPITAVYDDGLEDGKRVRPPQLVRFERTKEGA